MTGNFYQGSLRFPPAALPCLALPKPLLPAGLCSCPNLFSIAILFSPKESSSSSSSETPLSLQLRHSLDLPSSALLPHLSLNLKKSSFQRSHLWSLCFLTFPTSDPWTDPDNFPFKTFLESCLLPSFQFWLSSMLTLLASQLARCSLRSTINWANVMVLLSHKYNHAIPVFQSYNGFRSRSSVLQMLRRAALLRHQEPQACSLSPRSVLFSSTMLATTTYRSHCPYDSPNFLLRYSPNLVPCALQVFIERLLWKWRTPPSTTLLIHKNL